jgi:hypothetical protein
MRVSLAGVFLGIFFVYVFGITRVRAETALSYTGGPGWWSGGRPDELFKAFVGVENMHPRDLAIMGNMNWITGAPTGIMPPHQIEGMKLASGAGAGPRKVMAIMIAAVVLALPVSIWATWSGYYYTGAGQMSWSHPMDLAGGTHRGIVQGIERELPLDKPAIVATAAGIAFSLFLAVMRSRFLWWPLHPVGFALGWSFWANYHWFSWLLAWVVKSLALRYGGASTYRRIMNLCIGILVGHYANSVMWAVITVVQAKGGIWASMLFKSLS